DGGSLMESRQIVEIAHFTEMALSKSQPAMSTQSPRIAIRRPNDFRARCASSQSPRRRRRPPARTEGTKKARQPHGGLPGAGRSKRSGVLLLEHVDPVGELLQHLHGRLALGNGFVAAPGVERAL